MSDDNRFFRFLSRLNAVIIAAIGAACILGIAGIFWSIRDVSPPVERGHFAPVPKEGSGEFVYRLDDQDKGTVVGRESILDLKRREKDSGRGGGLSSGSYGRDGRRVNLLAINRDDTVSHWLFRGYDRSILAEDRIFPSDPSETSSQPPVALAITTIDADTDGDGDLSATDKKSLYFYRAGSEWPSKVLVADTILQTRQTSASQYLVVYEQDKSAFAATFSLPDFKLIKQSTLPEVPK